MCDDNKTTFAVKDLCDGDPPWRCQDRTDESFCECGKMKWKCLNESSCIESVLLCDGDCDCQENCSDEDEGFCAFTHLHMAPIQKNNSMFYLVKFSCFK